MAIAFVQKAPNTAAPTENADTPDAAVSFGSLPAIGNLVVVVTSVSVTTLSTWNTPTDNQGHTYYLAVTRSETTDHCGQVNIWYTVVTTSSGTFTVTVGNTGGSWPDHFDVGLLEYSGCDTNVATVCEATNSGSDVWPTQPSSGSVTPAGNAVYVGAQGGYATLSSDVSDQTVRFLELNHSVATISVADTIGSGVKAMTWTLNAGYWCAAVAAFKASSTVVANPLNSRSTIVLGQPRRLGGLLQTPATRVRTGRR